LITAAPEAKQVRLLGWDSGGQELEFWAEHFDGDTYVHTLSIPGLVLSGGETAGPPVKLADLRRNAEGAVVTGDCAAGTLELSAPAGSSGPKRFPVATRDARLVSARGVSRFVATRSSTCDGPEDLWVWPSTGAAPFKVADGVSNTVMRTVADAPVELPDDITARAPA
jgi:hypothetical protein